LLERIFESYQDVHVDLYGSANDLPMASEIASFFGRATIENLAGKTTLFELAKHMHGNNLIISVDTGGMHFANMFGRPLICIYGPTNPMTTGPIFTAPVAFVMPEGCSMKGGFPTEDVESEAVFEAVSTFYGTPKDDAHPRLPQSQRSIV
jgi:ADP-heptose:LPS heptosyltransferase